ncbi:MAG: hypothetical protein M3Q55_14895 [Acidobacteriota bacterium]|nr:hypothetical protein [Acidobacteriota bacterium]
MAGARLIYRIDRGDVIADTNDAWAHFAQANQAPQLSDVLGQSLWDHVSDNTTRQIYRDLIARVRAGHEVTFPYRCDAPALRRFMRMTMRPAPDRGVLFDSVIERAEARPAPPLLGGPAAGSSGVIVRVCSWCKRVHVRETWQEVEVAVESLGLFDGPAPALTHGMCEDCYARIMQAGGL